MITADTITDDQIRELRRDAELNIDHENRWWQQQQHLWTESGEHNHDVTVAEHRRLIRTCEVALSLRPADRDADGSIVARAEARARCAAILNARAKVTP